MDETGVIPWAPLATLAAALVAYAVVTRAARAVARVAISELAYRAGHLDHLVEMDR